jgi:hypothetical protein
MDKNLPAREINTLQLTSSDFPSFYNAVLGLRFPLDVAQVLELRFIINNAADTYKRRADGIEDHQFREALHRAIISFAVENKHHRQRLIRILTMIRDLHTTHLVDSRVAELNLRAMLKDLQRARAQTVRHGLYSLIATIFAGLAWLGSADPGWTIKLLTLGLAYMSWDSFHSLPELEREPDYLMPLLNEVLRRRVETVNWKRLIHKLSLILGYKQIPGIVVFRLDGAETVSHPATVH